MARGCSPITSVRVSHRRSAPVPYMPTPIAIWGLEDMLSSPLGQHILSYEPPHGFFIPSFAMYDGSSNPYNHMLHFNQEMILSAGNDRLLCKVFPASLKRPALAWFHKLPRGSINSFSELWSRNALPVIRPSACLGTVPRPSACLGTVPRPSALTCLDTVIWHSALA